MVRSFLLALLVPLSCLAAAGPVAAQPSAPARVEERLFALYALEDMYRKAVPQPQAGKDALRRPPHLELAGFLAERRLLFDRLRRHLEKQKAPEVALIESYRNYGGAAARDFEPKAIALAKKHVPAFLAAAATLRKEKGWKDAEFAFDRLPATATSRNPFLIVERARPLLDKADASVDDLLAGATACLRAADMVPAAKAYDYYRAAFLSVAGNLANRAAAKDLGAAGFVDCLKSPAKGGRLALKAWQAYAASEPIDVNIGDQVLHRYVLACGYAGSPAVAYKVVVANCFQRTLGGMTVRSQASSNPRFWYDCARICSLYKDVSLAYRCLQQASTLGFRDAATARIDPDLRVVREHRLTADLFTRLFP